MEFGIWRSSKLLILLVCMVPHTLAVTTLRGLAFHPWAWMASISGLYFSCFVLMAWSVYLSWVKVHSMSSMIRSCVGIIGPDYVYGAPCIDRMFG